MSIDVLIIDKDPAAAVSLLEAAGASNFNMSFVDKSVQAVGNLRKHSYSLIVMGDKLITGDTFDVGLELRKIQRNKTVPVICIGDHPARKTKLEGVLKPYAISVTLADESSIRFGVGRIKTTFKL